MGKLPHAIRKELKNIAEKLPKSITVSKQQYYKEIEDLTHREAKNNFDLLQGQEFQVLSERTQLVKMQRDYHVPINHYKKLTQAYRKGGVEAVREYIKWVNKNNKTINSKYSLKSSLDALALLMKHKIKPIF